MVSADQGNRSENGGPEASAVAVDAAESSSKIETGFESAIEVADYTREVPPEGVSVNRSESSTTVIVSGEIDITLSADLKAALVEAFEAGKPVEIDALRASYMDVTALELLWAARQLAVRKGVVYKPGCAPAAVGPLLTQLGMGELEIFA